jgi:hypothetical protein
VSESGDVTTASFTTTISDTITETGNLISGAYTVTDAHTDSVSAVAISTAIAGAVWTGIESNP